MDNNSQYFDEITIRGTRPRPRVGLVGDFYAEDLDQFEHIFPTIRKFSNMDELEKEVEAEELDLIVIGKDTKSYSNWYEHLDSVYVICFSLFHNLPGPINNTYLDFVNTSNYEEYFLPEIDFPLEQRRKIDLLELECIKGWVQIRVNDVNFLAGVQTPNSTKAFELVKKGSIITDHNADIPLATIYKREGSNLGVAWLPNPIFDQVKWVEAIAIEWAKDDIERFPEFGDWTKSPDWMTVEEENLKQKIDQLEVDKQEAINEYDMRIASLHSELTSATLDANKGLRRLITAQGEDLVEEVLKVFQEFGFEVDNMDKILDPELLRREDLRLRDPSVNENWEAIVEVRGYSRSAGKTGDLQRISRFATFYRDEKDRLPDKRIYVVNGQIELSPDLRQDVLASAEEDIQVFSEDGGLIISSLDLFRALKMVDQIGKDRIMESIKATDGRWSLKAFED